jgi:hypothetical protein
MKKQVLLFAGILGLSSTMWSMDRGVLFIDVFGELGVSMSDRGFVAYPFGGNIGWAIADWFFIESGYRQRGLNNHLFDFGGGYQIPVPEPDKFGISNGRMLIVLAPNLKVFYTDEGHWGISSKLLQYDGLLYRNNIGLKIGGGIEALVDLEGSFIDVVLFLNVGFLFHPNRMNKIAAYEKQQEEARQLQEQRRQEEQRLQEQRRQEDEAERKKMAELYSTILESSGIAQIASYIQNYSGNRYFQSDSYTEIARRLTGNENIDLRTIPSGYNADIPNPYNFDSKAIYFCEAFTVQQWVDTSFLADISNGRGGMSDSHIYIRNVYEVRNIKRTVSNAYLRYVGTETYRAVSGAYTVVPMFDLLYSF